MKKNKIAVPAMLACLSMPGIAQNTETATLRDSIANDFASQKIDVGADRVFSRLESTAAVSTVYNREFNKRGSKDVANSLLGQGQGLVSLQNAGNYAAYSPTFYVRGLQGLSASASTPLILVDGLERDITQISPDEVESVSILKDAAAVAMYGFKGRNGAILVTTKRGKANTKRVINFTYDHVINFMARKPKFVDAFTYAEAMNEARANDGLTPQYSNLELNAFRTGKYPYLYPNVNWIDETFKNTGVTNRYGIEFYGGTSRLRYYTMVNLTTDKGFVKSPNENDGYSTQNKYSRANLRTNLDVMLTNTTKMKLNVLGVLTEAGRAGNSANLWDMIYSLPAAAFPVRNENGEWGGNTTWNGTLNPVAQSIGAGYTKSHTRTLYTDLTISQDLSALLSGLGANVRLAYDNWSSLQENHSKEYSYGMSTVADWVNGEPVLGAPYSVVTPGTMSQDARTNAYKRLFNFMASVDYNHSFGKHDVYSQVKYEYEFKDYQGGNTPVYRLNANWYTHYGYAKKYYLDLVLGTSASNLMPQGHKWAFSPTVSAAWVLSNEDFVKDNISWIDFLKLRASWGIINSDNTPNGEVASNFWAQNYQISGGGYMFGSDFSYGEGLGSTTRLTQMAVEDLTHEESWKYNFGLDATLFKGLNLSVDGYYQRRKNIWVTTGNNVSGTLGLTSPYAGAGIVDSWGFDASLDYSGKIGQVTLNVGGNILLNKTKIVEQLEAPTLYDNVRTTGHAVGQIFGLEAIGLFKDQADIDNSPVQQLGGTVVPGDIKYRDINGDGVIDANDRTAIGYSTAAPQLYYSFHLGAEWKGLGFDAMFQGTGRYSAMLTTKSVYKPLIGNTTISEEYYNNRWTPETPNARYPRLSSQSNNNNYSYNNTLFLADRSFLKLRNVEIYYNLPQSWLSKTKIVNKAKLYVRGVDLLCFDHIKISDPESYGATNPMTRSVVVGLTVGF